MFNTAKKWFTRIIVFLLVAGLNLGAIDGIIRGVAREYSLGTFNGLVNWSVAKQPDEKGKNLNKLPETAGSKPRKNPEEIEAKSKKEDKTKRTLYSKTFKVDEGRYKAEVSLTPIHYENEKKQLVDIDNTLVETKVKGFKYENKANKMKVYLAEATNQDKFLRLQDDKYTLEWVPQEVDKVEGVARQNSMLFPGIQKNVDLKYTITSNQVKEDIILLTKEAGNKFNFTMEARGVAPKANPDGSISLIDPISKQEIWYVEKPFMYDDNGETSQAVDMKLEIFRGKYIVSLTADQDWLQQSNRKYPVTIDPLIIQPDPKIGRDSSISSQYPNNNYRANHELWVGNSEYYGKTRTFAVFTQLNKIPANASITSAKISLYKKSGGNGSINLYPVEADWAWDGRTLTWKWWEKNRKTGPQVDSTTGPGTGWWTFDVKDLVEKWVDSEANYDNYGVALSPDTDSQNVAIFYSCDDPDDDKRPKLEVDYTTKPMVPANFQLHIDRKTGKIKADGTAVEDARIYLNSDDGQSFTASADGSGKWEKDGMPFQEGKTRNISMYYEYEEEVTDDKGNTTTVTRRSETTSQKFLVARYSKGARTKKLAKFYYKDGTMADKLNEVNHIETELEMVVGDYVLVLDPLRSMPYTTGPIIKEPDEEYRLREKIRPLYSNSEIVGDNIDATTGNFFAWETDIIFDAQGLPVDFYRIMNSQEPEMYRGPFGINWHLGYTKMLIMYEDGSVLTGGGDGGGYFFRPSGGGFVADGDVTDKLVKNSDSTYSIITKFNTSYHFDIDGMLDSITDQNGNTVTLTYDPEGLLSDVTDAGGRTIKLYYDELGRITLLEDPAGRQVEYAYDSSGRLNQVIDPNGGITSYEYEGLKITKITDPMEYDAVTNTYDSKGRVVNQKDAEGYDVNLTYSGGSTTVTDKNESEFLYNFDDNYRVLSIDGPEGESYSVQQASTQRNKFTSAGKPVILGTTVEGEVYKSAQESQTLTASSSNLPLVQYKYDDRGNREEVIDAKGNSTYYDYDNRNNLTAALNSDRKGTKYVYDDKNNLIELVDALNNQTKMTYDDKGNLLTVTDAEGRTISYTYYDSGQVKTVTDPGRKSAFYTYNSAGNVETITDGRGYTSNYEYDEISRLKELTDPKGNLTSYEYDNNGNLLIEKLPIGQVVNSYDYNNNLIGTQDAEGNVTTYRYDMRGDVIEETDPLLKSAWKEYDGNGNLIKVKDANSNDTNYKYDSLGRMKKVIEPTGDSYEYFYDPNGNRVGVKDPLGRETKYQYDKFNRLNAVIDPLNQWAEYTYDDLGNTRLFKDSGGTKTEYNYDNLYRVKEVIDALGNATQYTYDLSGNRETVTNAMGQTYTYYYDENNNLKKVVDPEGNTTEFEYDENNNRISMKDPLGNVITYQYDVLNRMVGTVDPMNNSSRIVMDNNGNRTAVTDGNNNTTNFKYDAAGRLWFVTDAKNNVTEYRYDDVGNLRFFIDANKNETEYRYNTRNLLTHSINPLGQTTSFQYDKNGNIKTKTDPNGNMVEYDYDELNRLLGTYYPDGNYVEYGYNQQGKREWMEDDYGTSWYDYDTLGRLLAVTNQNDMTVEYDYNEIGQKTMVNYPDGRAVYYDYDNLNRLKTVSDRFDKVTSYEYDSIGRRTKTALPNGVVTTYDYNNANRLTGIKSINAKNKLLAGYQYDYDNVGNRTKLMETVGDSVYTTEYFYDPLNQLDKVINPDGSRVKYDYDPVGNRLEMVKTEGDSLSMTKYYYNRANELTKFNVNDGPFTEFRYDNNGNRTAKIESGNRVTNYSWDYENRLTKVQLHQDKWVGFEYDGDGNRITKLSAMTQPQHDQGKGKDNGKGNDSGFIPPGKAKVKNQQAELVNVLLAKGGGGGGSGSGGGNGGGGGSGGGGSNGGGNSGGNGGGKSGGNSGGNSGGKGNGSSQGKGSNKDRSNNGKGNDKVDKAKKELEKKERAKKKDEAKTKKGYRQKGKYNNRGKHLGWYKNGKILGEKIELTYYLNDVSDSLTQVLMTYGEDGKFNAAYTYGLERINVEAVDETRPEAQDPLYYLYDGLGSVTFMVKPDGNKRDHYRYDEFGKPAPGNSKLSEDGRNVLHNTFGYTGEMWDEESDLLYLRARYYEPETGRFFSRDSFEGLLGNPITKHKYLYAENNPIIKTDPTGLMTFVIHGISANVTAMTNFATYLRKQGIQKVHPYKWKDQQNTENIQGFLSVIKNRVATFSKESLSFAAFIYGTWESSNKKGELNIVAHSGGGQIAVNAAAILLLLDIKVDKLILLDSPISYIPFSVKRIYNAYSENITSISFWKIYADENKKFSAKVKHTDFWSNRDVREWVVEKLEEW
ncbi:MAG: DNRLRE domain-containing protein [Clostridia bacterium]|nr:DNRLRE domain-containing protein [Clostridia bacterium]